MENKVPKEVLVQDIKELTPGIRIIVRPTTKCSHKEHRYTILNKEFGRHILMITNNIPETYGYEAIPTPICKDKTLRTCVYQYDIDKQIVYRLIDLDDSFEEEEIRKNKSAEEVFKGVSNKVKVYKT